MGSIYDIMKSYEQQSWYVQHQHWDPVSSPREIINKRYWMIARRAIREKRFFDSSTLVFLLDQSVHNKHSCKLGLIKYAHKKGYAIPLDDASVCASLCMAAVRKRNVVFLEWLDSQIKIKNDDFFPALCLAGEMGDLSILRWAHNKKLLENFYPEVWSQAVINRKDHIVSWANEIGLLDPYSHCLWQDFAATGELDMIRWLTKQGYKPDFVQIKNGVNMLQPTEEFIKTSILSWTDDTESKTQIVSY